MIIGEQLHTEYKVLKPLVKERGGGGGLKTRQQIPFYQMKSSSSIHRQVSYTNSKLLTFAIKTQ